MRFLAGFRLRSRNAAEGDGLREAPDAPAGRDAAPPDPPAPSEPRGEVSSAPPGSVSPGSGATPGAPERSTEPGVLARRIAVRAWGTIGLLLLAAAVIWALSWVAVVVVPLLIALFPAAALSPLRNRMVRAGWPRALAAFVLLFLMLGAIAAIIAGPIPAVLDDLPALVGSLRAAATHLDQLLAGLPGDSRIGGLDQLGAQVTSSLLGADPVASTVGVAMTAITVISGLLIAIISVFFLLYQGDRIGHGIVELLPRGRRADGRELGAVLWATLGAYVRAQLIIGLLDAVFIGLGLWLLGVPLVVPLAALIFIGAQIPIVGAFLAGTVSVLVALAHGGIVVAAAALAVIVVVQFTEGHFLEPLLMSRLVRLPAFAVIVAVAMGSAALGILGALLAVPVTACAVHTVQFIRKRRVRPA